MKLSQSISRNAILLSAFALLTAGILASTHMLTKDRIAAAERKAAQKALIEIVASQPLQHDNDLLEDTLKIAPQYWAALGLKQGGKIHIARHKDAVIAYLIPAVAPDGYSGSIKLLLGVTPKGKISGVRVLAHKETPGLGDKVDLKKSDWVLDFNDRHLDSSTNSARNNVSSWAVKKDGGDFDQFTGATITPRAVVNQVKRALEVFAAMQENDDLHAPKPETK